jgi:hypothetical protein
MKQLTRLLHGPLLEFETCYLTLGVDHCQKRIIAVFCFMDRPCGWVFVRLNPERKSGQSWLQSQVNHDCDSNPLARGPATP